MALGRCGTQGCADGTESQSPGDSGLWQSQLPVAIVRRASAGDSGWAGVAGAEFDFRPIAPPEVARQPYSAPCENGEAQARFRGKLPEAGPGPPCAGLRSARSVRRTLRAVVGLRFEWRALLWPRHWPVSGSQSEDRQVLEKVKAIGKRDACQ